MKKYPKFILLFVAMGLFLTNCSNDDDITPDVETEVEETPSVPLTAADYPVQNFMWQAMNAYYFWQSEVPDLSDDLYENTEDPAYVSYLADNPDPSNFYNTLLFTEDRFSFLSENYVDLVNGFQGVSKSNGLEFGLSLFGEGREVFGYVEYVINDSNASTTDIQRGDIFVTVDGTQLFSILKTIIT